MSDTLGHRATRGATLLELSIVLSVLVLFFSLDLQSRPARIACSTLPTARRLM